jgi:hypothetical protein
MYITPSLRLLSSLIHSNLRGDLTQSFLFFYPPRPYRYSELSCFPFLPPPRTNVYDSYRTLGHHSYIGIQTDYFDFNTGGLKLLTI